MKKIDLNKLSFEELNKKIEEMKKIKEKVTTTKIGVWKIGSKYFIRTVTMYFLGRLINLTDNEFIFEKCSWISDCGRFNKFVNGEFDSNVEIEPFPEESEVIISKGALIDAFEWTHELPNKVK